MALFSGGLGNRGGAGAPAGGGAPQQPYRPQNPQFGQQRPMMPAGMPPQAQGVPQGGPNVPGWMPPGQANGMPATAQGHPQFGGGQFAENHPRIAQFIQNHPNWQPGQFAGGMPQPGGPMGLRNMPPEMQAELLQRMQAVGMPPLPQMPQGVPQRPVDGYQPMPQQAQGFPQRQGYGFNR